MNKFALVATLVGALIAPSFVSSHMMTRDTDNYLTYDGTLRFWIRNDYTQESLYSVHVFNKDLTPLVEPNKFRTTLEDNEALMNHKELIDFRVQVKEKGKYYVCSFLEELGGEVPQSSTRICLRLQYD